MVLNNGDKYTYEYLILSPGVNLRYDQIPGSIEALDDPNSGVCSIYRKEYAYKTNTLREEFKGGKALFTLPKMPIKCGGAPQKIMYLSEDTWRKKGVRQNCDIHFYTSVGNMFPNCEKYAKALAEVVKKKHIEVHFQNTIKSVDGPNKKATFTTKDGEV